MKESNRCFKCGALSEETPINITTVNATIHYNFCGSCAEVIGDALLDYLYALANPHTSWENLSLPLELYNLEEEEEKEICSGLAE